jgi:outer membrane protein OmpA-like peptidoglycan-associated protein
VPVTALLNKPFMKLLPAIFCLFLVIASRSQTTEITLYFDYNKHELRPESVRIIDSIARSFAQKELPPQIQIYAHCDSIGGKEYNQGLSEKRGIEVSDTILDRLYRLKLKRPEIMIFHFGKASPIADNGTPGGRQLNRRVTISYSSPPQLIVQKTQPEATKSTTPVLKEAVKLAQTGEKIVLRNLNFYGGLRRLLPASLPVLNELLAIMKENPTLEIDIQGHICCVTGEEDGPDNETGIHNLSVQRAKTVYDFLITNGIQAKRLSFKGFGHQFPLTAERTPAEQEQNRRVEIKIVKK